MGMMLDAMPKLAEASIIKDGLGLEQRMHQSIAAEAVLNKTQSSSLDAVLGTSLRPDMIASLKRKDMGRPTSARSRPGYEIGVQRTRFCGVCRSKGHNSAACPTIERKTKKARKDPRCSNYGIIGHNKSSCATWYGRTSVL
uniref:Uncharacterized protein n=1 Tax=Avena sativa TaxID=4498 RepID=A0ACD5YQ32_AVESA